MKKFIIILLCSMQAAFGTLKHATCDLVQCNPEAIRSENVIRRLVTALYHGVHHHIPIDDIYITHVTDEYNHSGYAATLHTAPTSIHARVCNQKNIVYLDVQSAKSYDEGKLFALAQRIVGSRHVSTVESFDRA